MNTCILSQNPELEMPTIEPQTHLKNGKEVSRAKVSVQLPERLLDHCHQSQCNDHKDVELLFF